MRTTPLRTAPRRPQTAVRAATSRIPGTPLAGNGADPPLLQRALSALFTFPPILNAAAARARETIRQRGLSVGVDVEAEAAALAAATDWEAVKASLENRDLRYPAYYLAPFHCYADGNLNWDAAFQAYAASAAVHATVMSPLGVSPPVPSRDGDVKLRSGFSECTRELMVEGGVDPDGIHSILDAGCSVGLSTRELLRAFPSAQNVVGVDLSPHMLAVARHTADADAPVRFIHAAAEDTNLPSASFDLVSMCLVAHECPADATAAIFAEAHRLLKPGGALAVMDMDTGAPAFAAVVANPAAFAGFSASEPHLTSYLSVDPRGVALGAGFSWAKTAANSPRHYTLVAVKGG